MGAIPSRDDHNPKTVSLRACKTPLPPRLSPTGLNPTPASSGVGQAGSSSSPSYGPRSDQDSTGDPRFHRPMPVPESPMVETAGNSRTETPTEKKGRRNNPAIHSPASAFFVYYANIGGAYRAGGGG